MNELDKIVFVLNGLEAPSGLVCGSQLSESSADKEFNSLIEKDCHKETKFEENIINDALDIIDQKDLSDFCYEELIKAIKQVSGSKILQVEPLRFQYKEIEFEISLEDTENQIYIVSCVVCQNKKMSYDDVTKYMAAFIATEGIQYSSCLKYDLDLNQDNKTYRFVLYGELSFHFSDLINNPSGYLTEMILEDMVGKKEQYQQKLELALS